MRRIVLLISVLLLSAVLFSGCAGNTADIQVTAGEKFTLKQEQTAVLTGEDFGITFRDVVSDSRCPSGAACIQAGESEVTLAIKYQGSTYKMGFKEMGGSEGSTTAIFKDYIISYHLSPYPVVNQEIDDDEYVLEMKIEK